MSVNVPMRRRSTIEDTLSVLNSPGENKEATRRASILALAALAEGPFAEPGVDACSQPAVQLVAFGAVVASPTACCFLGCAAPSSLVFCMGACVLVCLCVCVWLGLSHPCRNRVAVHAILPNKRDDEGATSKDYPEW